MREKLIELLEETFEKQYDRNLVITARNTADFLISHGVVLPVRVEGYSFKEREEIDFDYEAED